MSVGVMTRINLKDNTYLIVYFEPKIVKATLDDGDWINYMNEEISQIEKINIWILVPRPVNKNVIGTKWISRNKLNEIGEVVINKAILVYKGYAQEARIDYGNTFAPMARLEGIIILLVYATYEKFKVY